MIGRIYGTGSSVPKKIVSNDDLAKLVDTNDAWIRERTGVARRRIAEEETAVSMAADASRKALEQSGIAAEELDLILVSTIRTHPPMYCVRGAETHRSEQCVCHGFKCRLCRISVRVRGSAGIYSCENGEDCTGHWSGDFVESGELEGQKYLHLIWRWSRGSGLESRGRRPGRECQPL